MASGKPHFFISWSINDLTDSTDLHSTSFYILASIDLETDFVVNNQLIIEILRNLKYSISEFSPNNWGD